ncbi:hypothetical protein GCM10010390_32430 [Streptomyces mordarskii]|uniref:Uncharacterized protein n=1 Tax=Streptomyces mordarskii TaxID=1226758 RepID=A0ABN1CX98_9ACTN
MRRTGRIHLGDADTTYRPMSPRAYRHLFHPSFPKDERLPNGDDSPSNGERLRVRPTPRRTRRIRPVNRFRPTDGATALRRRTVPAGPYSGVSERDHRHDSFQIRQGVVSPMLLGGPDAT